LTPLIHASARETSLFDVATKGFGWDSIMSALQLRRWFDGATRPLISIKKGGARFPNLVRASWPREATAKGGGIKRYFRRDTNLPRRTRALSFGWFLSA
jgi:hypothetical protein